LQWRILPSFAVEKLRRNRFVVQARKRKAENRGVVVVLGVVHSHTNIHSL
jgi:hypothetical protein